MVTADSLNTQHGYSGHKQDHSGPIICSMTSMVKHFKKLLYPHTMTQTLVWPTGHDPFTVNTDHYAFLLFQLYLLIGHVSKHNNYSNKKKLCRENIKDNSTRLYFLGIVFFINLSSL